MKPTVVFFCVCLITAGKTATVEESTAEDENKIEKVFNGKTTKWWDVLPPDNTSEKIGDGVLVYAHIIYDGNYSAIIKQRDKRQSEGDSDLNKEMEKYFEKLFEQMKNLSAFIGKWFDERETLKKVKAYGKSLGESNNTIFYFYTWTTYPFAAPILATGWSHSTLDVETSGTFCSAETSAAVMRHHHGSLNYWATVKSTAVIFGSKHFASFSPEDRRNMNKTFLRCPVEVGKEPTDIPDIPSC
uniref:28 kDa Metastriate family member n=1 Tax=Rhipicephalus zambeziensis TaxID=60191 RepID=A0A224Y6U5_9ACAR